MARSLPRLPARRPEPPASVSPILELDRVSINFGGVRALEEFSLRVEPAEIRGLIGPNGSGKSTAFNVITGLYRLRGGDIRVGGRVGHRLAARRDRQPRRGADFPDIAPVPRHERA